MTPDSLRDQLAERFAQLPAVVQNAITSANISQQLRALAETHKLHIDQWESLENEVMLTLFGIQQAEDLPKHIQTEVGVSDEEAKLLTADISKIVFEPVRQELERQLEHPGAVAEKTTGVEDMRTQVLADAVQTAPAAGAPAPAPAVGQAVTPGTPPPAPPTIQVERAPVSPSYQPATPSHERKTIDGDPYREQLN